MKRFPVLPFSPKDFLSSPSVASMTTEEVGAYVLLLFHAWVAKEPGHLPADEESLRKICRASKHKWKKICQKALQNFDRFEGKIFNRRMVSEYQKCLLISQQRQSAAKARWDERVEAMDANALRNSCKGSHENSFPALRDPAPNNNNINTRDIYCSSDDEGKSKTKNNDGVVVPEELKGLELYEADTRLCKRWDKCIASWRAAFPGVDIEGELRRAHAWEVSNPQKRKVDKARFLYGWFSRQQDKGGSVFRPAQNETFTDMVLPNDRTAEA